MEGDALAATIKVLVQGLINLCKNEISLSRDLKKNADKLNETLHLIQSFLDDAQTKSIAEEAVKTWLKELEAEAFDADNALDELNYQLLRKKFPSFFFPSFNHFVQQHDLALRIIEINTRFESINKRAMNLGLQQKLDAAPAAVPDAAIETDSVAVDPVFIGRDDDVSKIVEMLTTPTEEGVSILPIIGMGGLGKTTLARRVFNHEKIKTHFGQHIWVHVSRDFDAVALLKKILKDVKGEKNIGVKSRQGVLKMLKEELGTKTYLLVLDDIWNEDPLIWEDFINSWSGISSTKGNSIIVTTRSTEVGAIVKTLDFPPLNFLSVEECWSIIKCKAFKEGDISMGLEAIGLSIAERCHGLPLAANVVGGVLRGKSHDVWRSINVNWLSDIESAENIISWVLQLSYHHLSSSSLKKCFAYCSIFSKGARIERQQLIELWMAEGFLQASQTSDMETVGNQFLKVLLQNTLLQVVDRDRYGEVKHFCMHDLVHDVAASKLRSSSMHGYISDRARYIRWRRNGDVQSQIPKEKAKWLRAVFYEDKVSNIIFQHFRSLHALTLTLDNDVRNLPNSIRKLIHLRYLHISGFDIKCLPKSISELYQLQTLRAESRELPSTLTYLINLRHLHVPDYTRLPPQLGRLTSLQTIPRFDVQDEEGYRIVELGSLKNLKGELKIGNLEKVQGEEESMKVDLSRKSGIVRLALFWSAMVRGESREGEKNVLNGLQPHPNLMVLEIVGYTGASFPLWTLKMEVYLDSRWEGLNNVMEVTLSECLCDEIPSLGHLPRLKFLYLSSLENVKSIGSSFYGIDSCYSNTGVCKETISLFPALERLELWNMRNLIEWEEVEIPGAAEVKVFPCLEYLTIRKCKKLESVPCQFPCLKEFIIHGNRSGLPLTNICGIKLKTLTKLQILNVRELVSLPDWLFLNNQELSVLEIMDCRSLIELPDGVHSLNHLEVLNLRRCENLRSIPCSVSCGLTSLIALSILGCPKLINFPVGVVESCAPLLEKLNIDVGDANSWHCVSFKKAVDGILQLGSGSVGRLELRGEDWDTLPDQLQHLTSLSHLFLFDFGVEELPEWFGNFSSLSELSLIGCKKLKHLPSVETIRRLTNLTDLLIYNSPLLEERCTEQQSDDADSEWPKICLIHTIRIGHRVIRENGQRTSYEVPLGVRVLLSKDSDSDSFFPNDSVFTQPRPTTRRNQSPVH